MQKVDRLRSKNFDGYVAGTVGAETVIFLHGWAGSKEIWLGFLKQCPSDFAYIALDLPGTGGTPSISKYDPQTIAQWLEATADEIGIDRFHLVGHSMGGNIAAWTASLLPKRIRTLNLISPALAGHKIESAKSFLSKQGRFNLRAASIGAGILGLVDVAHPHHHTGGQWRSWWRRYRYVVEDNSPDGLHAQMKYLVNHPFEFDTLDYDLPVQIIHGLKDTTIPVARSQEAADSRPYNTKLLVYDLSLHCAMDEEQERAIADIDRFIRQASVPAPM